jgi:low affinity Fe/Cu permease
MNKKNTTLSEIFNNFAAWSCSIAGNHWTFLLAVGIVIGWITSGPFFHYSDTWQLIINTGTTIITFLMVFLIQHTQNRDNTILNLKLDELIKSHKHADNLKINLDQLNDDELKLLEKAYREFCNNNRAKEE